MSVERWSRDPAGGLGVSFFVTGLRWILNCISFQHSNLPYFKTSMILKYLRADYTVNSNVVFLLYTHRDDCLIILNII